MLLKDGIVKLRQKGASLGLIRELLATVDEWQFNVTTITSAIRSRTRCHSECGSSANRSRSDNHRVLDGLSTGNVDAGE
jgi:hypothetical protein